MTKAPLDETFGYDLIVEEVTQHARVLDLGCGNGELLDLLEEIRHADCYGVEISEQNVAECVERELYVTQGDIDEGLAGYKDNSFDYVILSQTLQSTKKPEFVLKEIMRICKQAIITFPNFGFYKVRCQLLVTGRMPRNEILPYDWHSSPNIHHLTIRDFERYCAQKGYPVKKVLHFKNDAQGKSQIIHCAPNLFAGYGFFILDGVKYSQQIKR